MKKTAVATAPAASQVKIPFFNVKRQYDALAEELRAAVCRVLDSGAYILGPEGRDFEAEYGRLLGSKHALGVSSGTAALRLALKALGVGHGDDVVVPAMTFIATATAVSEVGARPVLADVDPRTMNVGAEQLSAALTRKTKAVIPVHLYGGVADMGPIMKLAAAKGFRVVEDCAQAHLAVYQDRCVGTIGDIGAFSFYPTKNLGAAGDAGAVTTQDDGLAATLVRLRNVGRPPTDSGKHELVGYNSRLDEIQAAVLRIKLRRLQDWVDRRRKIASRYASELAGLPLTLPEPGTGGTKHGFNLFVVRTPDRDRLMKHLAERGIGTGVYYPLPLHLIPAYRDLGYKEGGFPEAERTVRTGLALPVYPELTDDEVGAVAKAVRSFFK
ncbi:MAG: DegT/DnrJ/EryC1/StrS family aminotransferase [Elusimicrobia bacterium]|nr:DegT/DnrJ/EryC1/StrS family aminotransferase [Elusimicrobiota bacterium]